MKTGAVGAAGLSFLIFFGLVLPFLAYRARDRLTRMRPLPTRRRLYGSTILQLTFFLLLALLTARAEGLDLWRRSTIRLLPAMVSALVLALMVVATRPVRRRAIERRDPRVYFTLPQGNTEALLWLGLSLMAGIAEETVYRGAFSDLGTRLTGSLGLAWALSVSAFTIAHANQGAKSMGVIAAFSLLAHVLVYATGTLLYAILLHAAYDVIAGFDYARLGRQLGYPPGGVPDAASETGVTTSPATSSP